MQNGFDTRELEEYARDLIKLANDTLPKESKKMLKKSALKLTTVNKNKFKSCNASAGSGATEQEMLKRFKAGKVYKYNGNLSCQAYSSHPLAHLLDLGFIHRGGTGKKGVKGSKNGVETWIEGYHFTENAQNEFKATYNSDLERFLDDMLDKHGL